MRHLIVLRGPIGSNRNKFIKQYNLQPYTLDINTIINMNQSPIYKPNGTFSMSNNHLKAKEYIIFKLEERMKNGDFTIINDTHQDISILYAYKQLCLNYGYEMTIIDFSDITLQECIINNKMDEPWNHVSTKEIEKSWIQCNLEYIPYEFNVIKPYEFERKFLKIEPDDWSNKWNRIFVFGDIHGCFNPLTRIKLEDDSLYIFIGDLIGEGLQSTEVLEYVSELLERDNVMLVEGPQETNLRFLLLPKNTKIFHYFSKKHQLKELKEKLKKEEKLYLAEYDEYIQKSFFSRIFTKKPTLSNDFYMIYDKIKYLKNNLDQELKEIVDTDHLIEKLENIPNLKLNNTTTIRQIVKKAKEYIYFKFQDKEYFITHGGVNKIPEYPILISSSQYINGVGDKYTNIDKLWNEQAEKHQIQIHGHRNPMKRPIKNDKSFNISGDPEYGGKFKFVVISRKSIEGFEIQNNVYDKKLKEKKLFLINKQKNKIPIIKKDLENNILLIKHDSKSDDIAPLGLFIDKATNEIIARDYDKTHNVNLDTLSHILEFPLTVYEEPDGYTGIIGYNSSLNELIFIAKSTINSIYTERFKKLFDKHIIESFGYQNKNEIYKEIKTFLQKEKVNLIFKVIDIDNKSENIIKYDKSEIILNDIVERELKFKRWKNYSNDRKELLDFANKYKFEIRKEVIRLYNFKDFLNWYKNKSEDMLIDNCRGYVLIDKNNFSFKFDLPFYKYWEEANNLMKQIFYIRKKYNKYTKQQIDNIIRQRINSQIIYDFPMWRFFNWIKTINLDDSNISYDITTLREMFCQLPTT